MSSEACLKSPEKAGRMPLQNAAVAPRGAAWLPRHPSRGRRASRVMQTTRAYVTRHNPAALQSAVEGFVSAVNSQDLDALCGMLSYNVVWSDRVWCSNDLLGPKKVRKVYEELFATYPDLTLHTEELLAREDANTVALHFTARGTCFGEWRGFPASGRRSTYSGVSLFTFDGNRDDVIKQITTYRQPTAEEYMYYLGHEDL